MQRIKSFLEKYEQGYLFPYSRIAWILLSFVFILGAVVYGISYTFNSFSSGRKEVHISKEEIRRDKVILEEEQEKYQMVTKSSYDKQLDSLKRLTPKSEWNILFKFVDDVEYVQVKKYKAGYYDPWYEYYYDGYYYNDYEERKIKRKVDNDTAYPVLINQIVSAQGIDSAYFSEKTRIVNMLIEIHQRIPSAEATTLMKDLVLYWLSYERELERSDITRIYSWMDKLEKKKIILGNKNKISGDDTKIIDVFSSFINLFANDSISEERIELVDETINSLQTNGLKKSKDNFKILQKILGSPLEDSDLKVAVNDYFENKLFNKQSKNTANDFNKYHNLFSQKLQMRAVEASINEADRLEKQKNNKEYLLIALIGIFQIVIILVLFSIQRVVKSKEA